MIGAIPDTTAEPAARLRRPSWRDSRLLIGVLLVFAAVALGARTVAAADRTVPVYAARQALPSGTALTTEMLTVVRVRLVGTAAYLDARDPPPAGRVLLRTVGAGELVPLSAVGRVDALQTRPVSIPLDDAPSTGLTAGSRVDVWASLRRTDGAVAATTGAAFAPPRLTAREVEVFAVNTAGGSLSASRSTTVQVLLDSAQLPVVLDALANGAKIALVPVPGSAPARDGS